MTGVEIIGVPAELIMDQTAADLHIMVPAARIIVLPILDPRGVTILQTLNDVLQAALLVAVVAEVLPVVIDHEVEASENNQLNLTS